MPLIGWGGKCTEPQEENKVAQSIHMLNNRSSRIKQEKDNKTKEINLINRHKNQSSLVMNIQIPHIFGRHE